MLAGHRWGSHGDLAGEELTRLRGLWEKAAPLGAAASQILGEIRSPEICNWDLENGFATLVGAIGRKEPPGRGVGHLASVTGDRWRAVGAYYLALRAWLPGPGAGGHAALLRSIDPEGGIKNRVEGMLGERTELKELYVERLCRCLEFWLGGMYPEGSPQRTAQEPAVKAMEERIRGLDPDGRILDAPEGEGDGRLEPCSHKALRRYDILVSSIGAGAWRGAMPMRGTDGLERAALLEGLVAPVEAWVVNPKGPDARGIADRLGEPDPEKVFLAAFLASILKSQALSARRRAEVRLGGPKG